MHRTLVTKSAVVAATTLALAALALPALLPPASGAGDGARVGATALVDTARGTVLMASVTGAARATKVSFTCRPRGAASTRTLGGVSSDIAVGRIVGLDAHRVTRCTAKAGRSTRSIARLAPGARARGARLVGVLGTVASLAGSVARIDVVISAPGTIAVRTAGGRRLLKTGRRSAGLHRLRVPNAPRGSVLVVAAVGRVDGGVVGGTLSAAPTPTPSATATPTPTATATPTPTPTPTPAPTPAPSQLTLACPGQLQLGQTITVSGALSPGAAGNAVVVRFVQPSGAQTSTTITTDAGGNYQAQQATDRNSPGTWSIQATFAGDGAVQPAQSPECTTAIQ